MDTAADDALKTVLLRGPRSGHCNKHPASNLYFRREKRRPVLLRMPSIIRSPFSLRYGLLNCPNYLNGVFSFLNNYSLAKMDHFRFHFNLHELIMIPAWFWNLLLLNSYLHFFFSFRFHHTSSVSSIPRARTIPFLHNTLKHNTSHHPPISSSSYQKTQHEIQLPESAHIM